MGQIKINELPQQSNTDNVKVVGVTESGNGVLVPIENSIATKEELAEIGAKVGELLGGEEHIILSQYPSKYGNIASGKWTGTTLKSYTYVVVPCTGGVDVHIKAGNYNTLYAEFKSYNEPIADGDTPDYCEGYTNRVSVYANQEKSFKTKNDCHFIWFAIINEGQDRTPADITFSQGGKINNLEDEISSVSAKADATKTELDNKISLVTTQISEVSNKTDNLSKELFGDGGGTIDLSKYPDIKGIIEANLWKAVTSNNYTHKIIEAQPNKTYVISANDSANTLYALLKSDDTPIADAQPSFCNGESRKTIKAGETKTITTPQDCRYIYFTSVIEGVSRIPKSVIEEGASSGKIGNIESNIGDVSRLSTTAKVLVEAINEVKNNVNIETDKSLSVSDKPADAKVVGQKLGEILGSTGGDIDLSALSEQLGIIDGGLWKTSSTSFKHKVIPVDGSGSMTITANDNANAFYSCLKSYPVPINNEAPDFCQGYSNRVTAYIGTPKTFDIPSDCNYVYIAVRQDSDRTPKSVSISATEGKLNRIVEIVDKDHKVVETVKIDMSIYPIYCELSMVATTETEMLSMLKNGKYGLNLANYGLYYKDANGVVSTVVSGFDNIKNYHFTYMGNEVVFDYDGNLSTKAECGNKSIIIDTPKIEFADYAEENWDLSAHQDGTTSVMQQAYSYMDNLCLMYPSIVTKYDPMASASYTDGGVTVNPMADVFNKMKAKGETEYPIYAKGIEEGDYTIGEYTAHLNKTPAYKTFVYKINRNGVYYLRSNENTNRARKRNVYIQASCQGGEYNSTTAVCHFAKELIENTELAFLFVHYDFYIVPVLEGYAVVHQIYDNAVGVNINRNYPTIAWRQEDSTWGKKSCDQFATKLCCSLVECLNPNVAMDTHCLTNNLMIGQSASCYTRALESLTEGWRLICAELMERFPQYFGTKKDVPYPGIVYSVGHNATAQTYFYSKGIEASALMEVIRQVNFIADENGNMKAEVRNDRWSNDSINISAFIFKNCILKLMQFDLANCKNKRV